MENILIFLQPEDPCLLLCTPLTAFDSTAHLEAHPSPPLRNKQETRGPIHQEALARLLFIFDGFCLLAQENFLADRTHLYC